MSSDNVDQIHERLRGELDRLGLKMAEAARLMGEESSQGLRDVCSGRKRASAELVAKLVGIGADGLYILTGEGIGGISNDSLTNHLTETANPVTPPSAVPQIDAERLARIGELLEAFAARAGKRWPAKRLVALAAEVYNVLADEPALDEPKVERILKLVVNR